VNTQRFVGQSLNLCDLRAYTVFPVVNEFFLDSLWEGASFGYTYLSPSGFFTTTPYKTENLPEPAVQPGE
jgi:hypothetical protein